MQESGTVKLKHEFTQDLNKEVIAFANTDGGKIYIGIEDDGTGYGIADADEIMLPCINHIRNTLSPDLIGRVRDFPITADGKTVIETEFEKGLYHSIIFPKKESVRKGCIRIGGVSISATESAILKIIRDTDEEKYENTRSLDQNLHFNEAGKIELP